MSPVEWPDASEYLSLASASVQGTGDVRCTAVALCDASGVATDVFQIGDVAVFYLEFEVDRDLAVPDLRRLDRERAESDRTRPQLAPAPR